MSARGALCQLCSHKEVLSWGNCVGFWSPCGQSNTKRSRQTGGTEFLFLMHFVLSCLEVNSGMYRKELGQYNFIARATAACLILCNMLQVLEKFIVGVVRLTIWFPLEECTSLFVGPIFGLIKTLLFS